MQKSSNSTLSAGCRPLSAVRRPLYAVRYSCPSAVCCPLKIKIARIFMRPVRQPDLPEELDDLNILRVPIMHMHSTSLYAY